MSQSYALTNVPLELRHIISAYLDFKGDHRRKMLGVFEVVTVRTDNSCEKARDGRMQPYGWQINTNLGPRYRKHLYDQLADAYVILKASENILNPHHPEHWLNRQTTS